MLTMAAERTGANEVTVVHVKKLTTEPTPLAAEYAALPATRRAGRPSA
jgi:hypothetical protein